MEKSEALRLAGVIYGYVSRSIDEITRAYYSGGKPSDHRTTYCLTVHDGSGKFGCVQFNGTSVSECVDKMIEHVLTLEYPAVENMRESGMVAACFDNCEGAS